MYTRIVPTMLTVRHVALTRAGGHVGAEHGREQPPDGIGIDGKVDGRVVTHERDSLLHGRLLVQVPVGPKRSVRTRSGGRPSRTSPLATTSTSAVGPHA
jgi:hypothetical protein